MKRHQLVAEINGIFSFDKASIIIAQLLADVVSSRVYFCLFLLDLKSNVIILSYAVLVSPKLSDKGPILSLLSLTFPAMIVHKAHCLVSDSFWDFSSRSLSETFNQILFALLVVVDGSLLKDINDRFIVSWRDVDIMLLQLLFLFLRDLIDLLRKWPAFFCSVLFFFKHRFCVFHIVIWNFYACLVCFGVLQVSLRLD